MKSRKYRLPRLAFVYDNVAGMKQHRITSKKTLEEVSRATLIPALYLDDWENNLRYPSKANYNKLADFYEWEIWE